LQDSQTILVSQYCRPMQSSSASEIGCERRPITFH